MSVEADGYDSLLIRCPRLGGEVTFAYCRMEGDDFPCMRIIQCWEACLPIAGFLRKTLTPAQAERFREQRPKEKLVSLVELVETTKREKRI